MVKEIAQISKPTQSLAKVFVGNEECPQPRILAKGRMTDLSRYRKVVHHRNDMANRTFHGRLESLAIITKSSQSSIRDIDRSLNGRIDNSLIRTAMIRNGWRKKRAQKMKHFELNPPGSPD